MTDDPRPIEPPPARPSLRSGRGTDFPPPEGKRFDIFLIDTGWNRAVSQAVREQVAHLARLHPSESIYVLSYEQSADLLKLDPAAIGYDPTILFYDLYARPGSGRGAYRGFRLNLGLMRHPEQALARLQEFARFVATKRDSERLDREVRRELHREGFDGLVRLLHESSSELLM
ncbi:MAG TPA: hypothetical protein VKF17_00465 [Isosphaeraceae bacterium]|nr:hypothetical protein [Isosphaeraceae bacterium]